MRKVILALVILAIPASTMAAINWYTSKPAWDAARAAGGYTVLWGSENYEESTVPPGGGFAVNDPLQTGVPNPPYFPVGLVGHPDLTVQSNLDPAGIAPNPRGAGALAAFAVGGGGFISDVVISNYFVDSHDVLWLSTVNAAGFNPMRFSAPGVGTVKAFGAGNVLLGTTTNVAMNPGATAFLGVISDVPIARLNLYATDGGAEGVDNMDTYVPEPATLAMLSLALLALRRR